VEEAIADFSQDAEVGIGFFVGSLSTLRPLFSRRWDGPPRKSSTSHDPNDIAPSNRLQPTTTTEMKRLSPAFRESEEEAIREMIVTSKDMYHAR